MTDHSPTDYPYIVKNPQGRAYIQGTDYAVDRITRLMTPRMTPQRLVDRFTDLSLAQLHAALLYYYDHQDEIDAPPATSPTAASAGQSLLRTPSVVQQKLTEEWRRLTAKGSLPRTK